MTTQRRVPRDAHRRLRDARRRMDWTQARLVQEVGASQSAISMFEAGKAGALSEEKIAAIAAALGVDLAAAPEEEPSPPQQLPSLWFRPDHRCVTNLPTIISGEVRFVPAMILAAAQELACPYCAGVLVNRCPGCGEPIALEGAFCTSSRCAKPLVPTPEAPEEKALLAASADAERRRRLEILKSSRARRPWPIQGASDERRDEQTRTEEEDTRA